MEVIDVTPEEIMDMAKAEPGNIWEKLLRIQADLKVEKGRYNEFGKFWSRSKEDILEAVKPLAHKWGCIVLCDDEMALLDNGWVYVKTTATLMDAATGDAVFSHAYAREPESKPKMDSSQTTGSAASYAGKRALGNLFAIDDTADADQTNTGKEPPSSGKFGVACTACGRRYTLTDEQYRTFQCPACGNHTGELL